MMTTKHKSPSGNWCFDIYVYTPQALNAVQRVAKFQSNFLCLHPVPLLLHQVDGNKCHHATVERGKRDFLPLTHRSGAGSV